MTPAGGRSRRLPHGARSPSGPSTALTYQPQVLYQASFERIHEAQVLLDARAWGLSMYVSELAVEALLQAFATRRGARRDAHHDLRAWLRRCPDEVLQLITLRASGEWSLLDVAWSNSLRYLSQDGLLGYLGSRKLNVGIKTGKGGREVVLKVNAQRLLDAARAVHGKGVSLWHGA